MYFYIGLNNMSKMTNFNPLKMNKDYFINGDYISFSYNLNPGKIIDDKSIIFLKHMKVILGEKFVINDKEFDAINVIGRYYFNKKLKFVEKLSEEVRYVVDVVFTCYEENIELSSTESGYWPQWNYCLKNANLAECVMDFIEDIPPENRNHINVIRYIASCMNEKNTTKGLIHGSWNLIGEYYHPSYWKNTGQLLYYRKHIKEPLKYGQCWTFAEVLTSFLRYLNIPTRTVCGSNIKIDRGMDNGIDILIKKNKGDTEYKSFNPFSFMNLHSDDNSIKTDDKGNSTSTIEIDPTDLIDYNTNDSSLSDEDKGIIFSCTKPVIPISETVLDETFNETDIEIQNFFKINDSTWNFHVWNEVYIERDDLPDCKLWHCIDSTPLIKSKHDDKYVLGPCPISYIKDCEFIDKYDFEYFNMGINSVCRLWKTILVNNNRDELVEVIYPYRILYKPSNDTFEYFRPVFINCKESVFKKDITSNYLAEEDKIELNYKKYLPFSVNVNNRYFPEFKCSDLGNVFVQICYLNGEEVVNFYRFTTSSINIVMPPLFGSKSIDSISIFIASEQNKKYWIDVIKC